MPFVNDVKFTGLPVLLLNEAVLLLTLHTPPTVELEMLLIALILQKVLSFGVELNALEVILFTTGLAISLTVIVTTLSQPIALLRCITFVVAESNLVLLIVIGKLLWQILVSFVDDEVCFTVTIVLLLLLQPAPLVTL